MSDDNNKKKDDQNSDDFNDFFRFSTDPENEKKKDGGKGPKKPRMPFWSILLTILAVMLVVNVFFNRHKDSNVIDYSVFRSMTEQGMFTSVEIGDDYYIGKIAISSEEKEGEEQGAEKGFLSFDMKGQVSQEKTYKTVANMMMYPDFTELLQEKGIPFSFVEKQNNYLFSIIMNFLPFILLIVVYFFLFRRMGSGMGSVFGNGSGKSKAVDEGKVKTRFSDVAGVDEAKEELMEVVDFLKSPKKYTDIGGKIPKGVLLVGPPGTGKTLLARAVAGEAGVPFFRISGSDFVEMFVGVGASRVRDLFKTAREKAPCIIFIDELDAIGKSRMNNLGGNDEREQTLNQLLVEMDGFDNEKGIIILAATNRADILDPALLRPGRFDRQVPVERPDVKGREAILRIHAKNVKLEDDVDFNSIAHGTTGFAGADLANVINEAALLAVRNGRKKVSMEDLNDAIDKVSIGLKKKNRSENEKERKLVAFHETGHALVGAFTPGFPPVNKITVVPRSNGVGGFTQYREKEESFFKTKSDMIGEVDSLLGGRAAEQIMLGEVSTGASNDISYATSIIKSMIVDYGMSDKFKNMTLGKGVRGNHGEPELVREFSEETQNYIDEEIARIMEERYQYVLKLLTKHKALLEYVAGRLLEKETIDGKEFEEIVQAEDHAALLEDKAKKEEKTQKKESVKTTKASKTEKKNSEKPLAKKTSSRAKKKSE